MPRMLILCLAFAIWFAPSLTVSADDANPPVRMVGFHIDMNMAQYRADYLKRWLTDLAGMGYNTIIWELEDGIEWETVPEARQPDALSKETFRDVLYHANSLGLENIPLFQTLGHAEYVLQHDRYSHLKAHPDDIRQYDPLHPEVVPLLQAWIEEYLDLFGEIKYFHLGADEARQLDYVQQSERNTEGLSVSQIFMQHVNTLSEPLVDRGITPIIWADMVLHHHGSIDELSRDVMLFDWMYDIWRGNGKVYIWGENRGLRTKDQLTAADLKLFGKYLFPNGDGPGVEPETFYSADYLADHGFAVVTCPASSSYGDNVFSPRHERHLRNTWDSATKGLNAPRLRGVVLTSWSVHLHPWELQHAQIAAVGYKANHPGATLDEFRDWYVEKTFGIQGDQFWKSAELLSQSCLFTPTSSLGFGKACQPVPDGHVDTTLDKIVSEGRLDAELQKARESYESYLFAIFPIGDLRKKASEGDALIEGWELASLALMNRASVTVLLLESRHEGSDPDEIQSRAEKLLGYSRSLRQLYEELYEPMIRPTRREQMIGYMFGSVEDALAELAGE